MTAADQFDAGHTPSPALLATPARTFGGKPLFAYSFGRRLLWRALFSANENAADQIFSLSLIFVLLHDDKKACEYLFDMPACKTAFFGWLNERQDGDYKTAVDLADTILDEAKKAEVRAVEEPGGELKKKA